MSTIEKIKMTFRRFSNTPIKAIYDSGTDYLIYAANDKNTLDPWIFINKSTANIRYANLFKEKNKIMKTLKTEPLYGEVSLSL